MPILTNFPLTLSVDALLSLQGTAAEQPAIRDAAAWAMDEAGRLARPALIYERLPIEPAGESQVRVGDTLLTIGPHADLLAQAHECLVAVMTIGPEIPAEATRLMSGGDMLRGFMLQAAGDVVLGAAGAPLAEIAQQAVAERQWGLSLAVAPGSLVGWSLTQQSALCGLLETASIGVSVTSGGALHPAKSASLLVGLGPGYRSRELHRACGFCHLRPTCLYRDA